MKKLLMSALLSLVVAFFVLGVVSCHDVAEEDGSEDNRDDQSKDGNSEGDDPDRDEPDNNDTNDNKPDDNDPADEDPGNDDPGEEDDGKGDSVDDPEDLVTISGTVVRVKGQWSKIAPNGDGIGTLCVVTCSRCPGKSDMNPPLLEGAAHVIKDADFTEAGLPLPFEMKYDPADAEMDKFYHISVVFKEDGGECALDPDGPILKKGDIVAMACGRFKNTGEDVDGIKIKLDWTLLQDYY